VAYGNRATSKQDSYYRHRFEGSSSDLVALASGDYADVPVTSDGYRLIRSRRSAKAIRRLERKGSLVGSFYVEALAQPRRPVVKDYPLLRSRTWRASRCL